MLFFALLLSVVPLRERLSRIVVCHGGQLLLLCMPEFMVSAFALVFRCFPSASLSLQCHCFALVFRCCPSASLSLQCHCFALVGPVVWCTTCRCLRHHLHWWGQLFGALHAGVCSIICTGGASCLVHYMQVSAASFALVGPVVWCTTCRCLQHHLHWWGQLFGALHAGVCGIICTGGASCLVHYMQVSAASFALGACCTSVSLVVLLPLVVTVVSTVSTDVVMWAHFSCVCGFVCPSVPASRFCPDTMFQTAQPFATKFSNWMKYWGCHQQGQIICFGSSENICPTNFLTC